MTVSINGSGGITYPDGSVNTTRSVSTAGDTMTGDLLVKSAGNGVEVRASQGCVEIIRTAANPYIDFKSSDGEDFDCRIQQVNNGLSFLTGGNAATQTNVFIDSVGRVTSPYQPAFSAYMGGGVDVSVTTGTAKVVPLTATKFNVGNHFNTSSYTFTAPIAGYYFVSGAVSYAGSFSAPRCITYVFKNGSQDLGFNIQSSRSSGNDTGGATSAIVYLAVGDTIALATYQDSGSTQNILAAGNSGWTYLTARFLG